MPLKGQCHEINVDSYSTKKGLHFAFLLNVLGQIFLTHRNVFYTKVRITQRNLDNNRKYFNQLASGPGMFELCRERENRRSKISLDCPFKEINVEYIFLGVFTKKRKEK